jgi:hypothetical protein
MRTTGAEQRATAGNAEGRWYTPKRQTDRYGGPHRVRANTRESLRAAGVCAGRQPISVTVGDLRKRTGRHGARMDERAPSGMTGRSSVS